MTDIDKSRAPIGVVAARKLVDAVVEKGDRNERFFLEAKSTLDFGTKKDRAKLAKFVLGAANRMPERAARAFEGYGVMVIGASEGSAPGIPWVEALDIEKAVLPYLGVDGPKYDFVRVPVGDDGYEVLVLLVDPPQHGQGPFICRKTGDEGLRDGAVYVRTDGETREATSGELEQLLQRGRSPGSGAELDVRVLGVVHPVELDPDLTVEEYISHHSDRLHAALTKVKPAELSPPSSRQSLGAGLDALSAGAFEIAQQLRRSVGAPKPETRTEAAYLEAIADWEQRVREAWPTAITRLIGALGEPAEIEVLNRGKTFLADVELKVRLEGTISGASPPANDKALSLRSLGIPRPPRAWGPRFDLDLGYDASDLAVIPRLELQGFEPLRWSRWNSSTSLEWEFRIKELRPKGVEASDGRDLVLYTTDSNATEVHGSWEITARDHHELYTGNLQAEVGAPIDLTTEFRRLLELGLQ